MTHLSYSSRQSQHGATLIVVLMLLLMISVIGVMALKQSGTDLKLASSDQINTLLLQSSDSSVQRLEDIVNDKPGAPTTSEFLIDNPTGALGHFILDPEKTKNDSYTYCFDPTTTYLGTTATIARNKLVMTGNAHGSCLDGSKFKTTTDMGVAITQVTIKRSKFKEGVNQVFSHVQKGQDSDDDTSRKNIFDIKATSAVPTYNDSDVKSGYNKSYFDPEKLKKHLKDKNIPNIVVYEQVDVTEKTKKVKCIDYGKSTFDSKCDDKKIATP